AIAAGRPLWLADYSPVRIDLPRDWRRYHILQYTGQGRVEGFGNRDVDRNTFHGSLDDLHAAASGRWTDLPNDRPVSSHAQTVKAIQRALNAGGATPPLVEDGLPGPKTRAALA